MRTVRRNFWVTDRFVLLDSVSFPPGGTQNFCLLSSESYYVRSSVRGFGARNRTYFVIKIQPRLFLFFNFIFRYQVNMFSFVTVQRIEPKEVRSSLREGLFWFLVKKSENVFKNDFPDTLFIHKISLYIPRPRRESKF